MLFSKKFLVKSIYNQPMVEAREKWHEILVTRRFELQTLKSIRSLTSAQLATQKASDENLSLKNFVWNLQIGNQTG